MTLVSNIQRFSTHDGQGVRTTVFFMGCPLSCAWCHNPECIGFEQAQMFYKDRCTGCGECESGGQCPRGARQTVGREYSPSELVRELMRDRSFFDNSGGGVTLSGGEALAQDREFLSALLDELSREKINVNIDTSGFAPWEAFELALPHTKLFLYDLKVLDDSRHIKYTGQSNGLILQNLERLARAGAAIELRLPLIEGVNAGERDIADICGFLRGKNIAPEGITLLPYHSLGEAKRERLGLPPGESFSPPGGEKLEKLCAIFTENGFKNVQINR